LALMDALIFFTVALLISSILISRAHQDQLDVADEVRSDNGFEASTLLEVVLRASIGECVSLNVAERQLTESPTTSVGDCLSMEATALISGIEPRAFDEVNGMILGIIKCAAGPAVVPHLWIMLSEDGCWDTLLRIEGSVPVAGFSNAASMDLPVGCGEGCRVTLVLEPSFLLEAGGI
jgi:hypothetical protein